MKLNSVLSTHCSVLASVLILILALPAFLFSAGGHANDARSARWRLIADIAMHRFWMKRLSPQSSALSTRSYAADQGNLAVLQDDGTLFFPANAFDLDNKSLLFTRNSDGTYQAAAGSTFFDSASAQAGRLVAMQDDDTLEVPLGFSFPFYDKNYNSVFLNSDGNLTFTVGDVATSERDLARFLSGVPRIAPFFQDLNPSEGNGSVTVNQLPDRVIFSWLAVPLCCESILPLPVSKQTFQAILFADGRIQFAYAGIQSGESVVGLSPGRVTTPPTLVDLSKQSGAQPLAGAIPEVFLNRAALCVTCVTQRFYSTHEDAYDQLIIWANFSYLGGNTFALGGPVRNDVTGIQGVDIPDNFFDFSRDLGSATGRLQGLVQANNLSLYPDDPRQVFLGENNTLSVLGQEFGHRWLAYVLYPQNQNPTSTVLLGRQTAHWSFFFNSEASSMEGNEIRDNGDGSFTTVDAVSRYGSVDQYVMGLRGPDEVPPSFVVTQPSPTRSPGASPQIGVTFQGAKLPVTIDKIIQANGPRWPPVSLSQKNFNFGFIFVTSPGTTPTTAQTSKLDSIRSQWEQFWLSGTANRSQGRTTLFKAARITPLPAAAGMASTINATLSLGSPAPAPGAVFQMQSSDATVLTVPAIVTVPAGATKATFQMKTIGQGTATVTATSGGYEPISDAVAASPAAAVSGASFAAGYPVSPGSIISIFGANLSGTTQAASALPLLTTMANTSVSVGQTPAPLFYVSPLQVNAQVPFETLGGYAPLVISNNNTVVATIPLLLVRAAPGLFTASQDGTGSAAVLHAASGAPVAASSPARAGEFISIFATGLGPVSPRVSSGQAARASPLSNTVETPQVTIGGASAVVSFSGLAPGFVGLYQINVQAPAGVSGAALPLVVTVFGAASNTATIAVQ